MEAIYIFFFFKLLVLKLAIFVILKVVFVVSGHAECQHGLFGAILDGLPSSLVIVEQGTSSLLDILNKELGNKLIYTIHYVKMKHESYFRTIVNERIVLLLNCQVYLDYFIEEITHLELIFSNLNTHIVTSNR